MRINESIKDNLILLEKLTLGEKVSLLSSDTPSKLKGVARLGVPSISFTTPTKGYLRAGQGGFASFDKLDFTCFPSFSLVSCSFNRELLIEMGEAVAMEYLANEISTFIVSCSVLDSPYYGRGYELFGEDPYVVGELVSAFAVGLQTYGIGAILSDFVIYSGEKQYKNIHIDDFYLHERYLKPFKTVITKTQPLGIMVNSQVINDTQLYTSPMLKMLNNEYSFNGIVLSEWGGIMDRMESLKSGVHIELPGSGCFDDVILEAVEDETLDVQVIDSLVLDILNFIDITKKNRVNGYQYDRTYNHKLAEKVAEESICLLKNEENILPLDPNDKIAVIGNAQMPMIQVAGSSYVPVSIIDDPLYCMREVSPSLTGSNILHSEGYDKTTEEIRNELVYEALRTVMDAKAAVMFLGFDDSQVSECSDFESLELPANQLDLIDSILRYNKNIVVVLNTPICIKMPWLDKVKAVVDAKVPGEAFGPAVANILFGIVNPSGKLSCAYPALFPFGHGLSYTRFEYSDIYLEYDDDAYMISFVLENTGEVSGKEVVFLYVETNRHKKPYKRLVGFCKPGLAPGEKKKVTFRVASEELSIYDRERKCETLFSGDYTFHICASEQDVRLSITTYIEGENPIEKDFLIPDKRVEFEEVEKRDLYTLDSTLKELMDSPAGKRLYHWCYKRAKKRMGLDAENPVFALNLDMFLNTPLRKLVLFSEGKLTFKKAQGLIDICNGKPIRGVSKVLF